MKYLKYLLGFIVLLALIFIAIGFVVPSISYSSEVVIDKPVKEAWAVMNDESKTTEWLKGITKIEHISGEKNAVGCVTKYTFNENGQESVVTETIKTISHHEHVAMDFVVEGVMDMDYRIDFSEQDGKAHIKSSATTKGSSIFMRSMLPFIKGTMISQEDENLENLKTLIAANTTDYFPAPPIETEEEITN